MDVATPAPTNLASAVGPSTGTAPLRSVAEVLAELDAPGDGDLPVAAMREVQRRRDEFVPHLVALIRSETERARQEKTWRSNGPLYSLYLLAEFGAVEAQPTIVEAISLPGEGPDVLFGDAISDGLERILADFVGPDAALLDRLIDDRAVDKFVCSAAVEAYAYLVRDGRMPRDEAVRRLQPRLRALIDAAIDRSDEFLERDVLAVTWLVKALCDLDPRTAEKDVREAFDRDLVEPFFLGSGYLDDMLAEGEEGVEKRRKRLKPTRIADAVAELERWRAPAPKKSGGLVEAFAPLVERAIRDAAAPRIVPDARDAESLEPDVVAPIRKEVAKVGRNDPCPCGSGKKYKKCCGGRG